MARHLTRKGRADTDPRAAATGPPRRPPHFYNRDAGPASPSGQRRQDRCAEGFEVVGAARVDQVPVLHDLAVDPDRTGVGEIALDGRVGRQPAVAYDVGLDQQLRTVADGRHRTTGLPEPPDE